MVARNLLASLARPSLPVPSLADRPRLFFATAAGVADAAAGADEALVVGAPVAGEAVAAAAAAGRAAVGPAAVGAAAVGAAAVGAAAAGAAAVGAAAAGVANAGASCSAAGEASSADSRSASTIALVRSGSSAPPTRQPCLVRRTTASSLVPASRGSASP